MDKENGYELVQGKDSSLVRFDAPCPKCGNLIKAEAWIESNSLLEQKQCSVCGYDKTNTTRLARDGLSDIDTDIEIRENLHKLALKGDVPA